MSKLIVTIIFFSLASCAIDNSQQQLNYDANRALDAADFQVAKQKYQASLNVSKSNGDKQYEAIAMYGLGRSNGYLCNFEEAEKWFLESIQLRSILPNTDNAYLSQNRLELASLYIASKQFENANIQFEKAINLLENLNIRSLDPIGYANILDDYVVSLEVSGHQDKALEVKKTSDDLRISHSNKIAGFTALQYPINCNTN